MPRQQGWWSQPFAPEGSVSGEGIAKQLGCPNMDPLTVLVREAAQNSWDARREASPVEFGITIRRLGTSAAQWRDLLLPGPDPAAELMLDRALTEQSVLLIISDRNTHGLGGPMRASGRVPHGSRTDFLQFLRNIGEPRDQSFGGGTYGFGKGIFYRVSEPGAILVDTSTPGPEPTRRMMGAALGESFYIGDDRYTGRHWWGEVSDIADPVLGARAKEIADVLHLPGFSDGKTGTDVVLLAPDLGSQPGESGDQERSIVQAAEFIASSVLWNLWPKFIPDADGQFMRFSVRAEEDEVNIPEPDQVAVLQPFAASLREVRSGGGRQYSRKTPPKDAGAFALTRTTAARPEPNAVVESARPINLPLHHVARMRVPELIVDYLEGPVDPDPHLAYAGVFRASHEADSAFAASEPPTHDAWIAVGLTGSYRGVVQNAQTFIRSQISEALAPRVTEKGENTEGLGGLSVRLGGLIQSPVSAVSGSGSSGHKSRKGTGSNTVSNTWHPRIDGTPRLELSDGVPYFVARVDLPSTEIERTVRASVEVVVEGDRAETAPPVGALVPRILHWASVDTREIFPGVTLTVEPGKASSWLIYASHIEDGAVRMGVSESSGGRHGQ